MRLPGRPAWWVAGGAVALFGLTAGLVVALRPGPPQPTTPTGRLIQAAQNTLGASSYVETISVSGPPPAQPHAAQVAVYQAPDRISLLECVAQTRRPVRSVLIGSTGYFFGSTGGPNSGVAAGAAIQDGFRQVAQVVSVASNPAGVTQQGDTYTFTSKAPIGLARVPVPATATVSDGYVTALSFPDVGPHHYQVHVAYTHIGSAPAVNPPTVTNTPVNFTCP